MVIVDEFPDETDKLMRKGSSSYPYVPKKLEEINMF